MADKGAITAPDAAVKIKGLTGLDRALKLNKHAVAVDELL